MFARRGALHAPVLARQAGPQRQSWTSAFVKIVRTQSHAWGDMPRRFAMSFITGIMLLVLAGVGSVMQTAQTTTIPTGDIGKTVLDGVYTAAQAAKGRTQYETNCIRCHEVVDDDPQGPPLMGRGFIDRWREENLDVLFGYMTTNMPAGSDVRLSDETFLQVLAYILAANAFPEGPDDLTPDKLGNIRLVGSDGPRPLPRNTLVQLIGCLTEGSGGNWMLTKASKPTRIRRVEETSAEELRVLDARPLGTQIFGLPSFRNIRFDFDPAPYKGHKVKATGVFIPRPEGDRINLTSLETVASTCER